MCSAIDIRCKSLLKTDITVNHGIISVLYVTGPKQSIGSLSSQEAMRSNLTFAEEVSYITARVSFLFIGIYSHFSKYGEWCGAGFSVKAKRSQNIGAGRVSSTFNVIVKMEVSKMYFEIEGRIRCMDRRCQCLFDAMPM